MFDLSPSKIHQSSTGNVLDHTHLLLDGCERRMVPGRTQRKSRPLHWFPRLLVRRVDHRCHIRINCLPSEFPIPRVV